MQNNLAYICAKARKIVDSVTTQSGFQGQPLHCVDVDTVDRPIVPAEPAEAAIDHFKLIFRAGDKRQSLYTRLAEQLLKSPLR